MTRIEQIALCMCVITATYGRADTQLTIKHLDGNISISWTSDIGNTNHLYYSTNIGATWVEERSPFVTTSRVHTISIEPTSRARYFRLREDSPVTGRILITNGVTLSGMVEIPFSTHTDGTKIHRVELWDAHTLGTNMLGAIDMPQASHGSFVVDSALLQNGIPHRLYLRIADDFGDRLVSSGIRVRETPKMVIQARNPISFNEFEGETGSNFWHTFTPLPELGAHSWRVAVTNDTATTVLTWGGDIASSTNLYGAIEVRDVRAMPYEGSWFRGLVSLFDIHGILVTEKALETRIMNPPYAYGYAVVTQPSMYLSLHGTNYDWVIENALTHLNTLGDYFDLSTETWETIGTHVGVLDTRDMWDKFKSLLYGEYDGALTHLFLWSWGSPVETGWHFEPGYNITPNEFEVGSMSNRLACAIVGGHNMPLGFMSRLVDTRKRTKIEMIRKGLYPRFGLFFSGYSLPSSWDPDIDNLTNIYINRLLERAFQLHPQPDPTTGLPVTKYTFDEAMEYASMLPAELGGNRNPISTYIDWVGCAEYRASDMGLQPY